MNQELQADRRSMMGASPVATRAIGAAATRTGARAALATRTVTRERAARYVWAAARLAMGWVFLWPFLDMGLGARWARTEIVRRCAWLA
jgi:hypothetical protein